MRRTIEEKIFFYSMPRLYEKKIEELKTVEERVVWVLKHHPDTRNSDKLLLLTYWVVVDKIARVPLDEIDISKITNFDTIRRCRQLIQNTLNLFIPTDEEVLYTRRVNQVAVKDYVVERSESVQAH